MENLWVLPAVWVELALIALDGYPMRCELHNDFRFVSSTPLKTRIRKTLLMLFQGLEHDAR
jgi:hypothetical protein